MQKNAALFCTLYRVLDMDKLKGELVALRIAKGLSQRALAAKIGVSYSKIQDFESGATGLWVHELLAWIQACGEKPALWFAQFLSEPDRRVAASDEEYVAAFRKARRIRERRVAIELLVKSWIKADAEAAARDSAAQQVRRGAQGKNRTDQ